MTQSLSTIQTQQVRCEADSKKDWDSSLPVCFSLSLYPSPIQISLPLILNIKSGSGSETDTTHRTPTPGWSWGTDLSQPSLWKMILSLVPVTNIPVLRILDTSPAFKIPQGEKQRKIGYKERGKKNTWGHFQNKTHKLSERGVPAFPFKSIQHHIHTSKVQVQKQIETHTHWIRVGMFSVQGGLLVWGLTALRFPFILSELDTNPPPTESLTCLQCLSL